MLRLVLMLGLVVGLCKADFIDDVYKLYGNGTGKDLEKVFSTMDQVAEKNLAGFNITEAQIAAKLNSLYKRDNNLMRCAISGAVVATAKVAYDMFTAGDNTVDTLNEETSATAIFKYTVWATRACETGKPMAPLRAILKASM